MDWLTFVSQWGLPGVIIIGIGLFLWRITPWIGKKIDWMLEQWNEVNKTHINFVNKTDQRLGNIEGDMDFIKKVTLEQVKQNEMKIGLLQKIDRNTSNGQH